MASKGKGASRGLLKSEMAIYCLKLERKEFYNTRIVATCIMFEVEEKFNNLPRIDEEKLLLENKKYVEYCRSEGYVDSERELYCYISKNDIIRWSKQIGLFWKIGKQKKIFKEGKSISTKSFDNKDVKLVIKDFKNKKEEFGRLEKYANQEEIEKEMSKYRLVRYEIRHCGCKPFNRKEMYGLIRNTLYPVKSKK
jgi:hypothetical protein